MHVNHVGLVVSTGRKKSIFGVWVMQTMQGARVSASFASATFSKGTV